MHNKTQLGACASVESARDPHWRDCIPFFRSLRARYRGVNSIDSFYGLTNRILAIYPYLVSVFGEIDILSQKKTADRKHPLAQIAGEETVVISSNYEGDKARRYKAMTDEAREKILARAKRIAGQIAGVQRMIEQDRYCVDILNQISALRSALDSLGVVLLTNHVETCVLGSDDDGRHPIAKAMKPDQLVDELRTALSRFLA